MLRPLILRGLLVAVSLGPVAIPSVAVTQAQASSAPRATSARGRALTIEDYYRVKPVGAPEMSPDGRWVAFAVATRVEATNTDASEVWLVPADASSPARRVSPEGVNATAGRWTADGRLRFVSDGKNWSVDPARPDSVLPGDPDAQRARGVPGRSVIPSPDGRWSVVVRDIPPPKREVTFVSDFEKRHEERFKGAQFDWLDFQRDGQPFPVPNRLDPHVNPPQEIFLTPNNDGAERQLTNLSLRPIGTAWNSTSTRLVFTADSGYREERRYGASEIYTVAIDGAPRRLTTDDAINYTNARYSPDGRWILYTRQLSTDAVIHGVLRHAVGGEGPRDHDQAVAADVRGSRENADVVHQR